MACLIDDVKAELALTVNSAMTVLYWDIGRAITEDLLKGEKPEYGNSSIASLANSLRAKYGKAFDRANLFRAIQFHQQFPEREKVVSLSRQLSWSHILALLPIKDPLAMAPRTKSWKARAVYLSTPEQIKGHFEIVYLTLNLFKVMQMKIYRYYGYGSKPVGRLTKDDVHKGEITPYKIIETLRNMSITKLECENRDDAYVPSFKRTSLSDALGDIFNMSFAQRAILGKRLEKLIG